MSLSESRVFGFVGSEVVRSLRASAWRERAHAAQQVLAALQQLDERGRAKAERHLAQLVELAMQLMSDVKFKVALAGLHVTECLIVSFGRALVPLLSVIVPRLAAELGGKHVVFVSAVVKVFLDLYDALDPASVALHLAEHLETRPEPRVVERSLNLLITALLLYPQVSFPVDAMLAPLVAILAADASPPSAPPTSRAAALVLELLAVLHNDIGDALFRYLARHLSRRGPLEDLRRRVAATALPSLSPDGVVEHGAALPPSAADGPGAPAAKPPSRRARPSPAPSPARAERAALPGLVRESSTRLDSSGYPSRRSSSVRRPQYSTPQRGGSRRSVLGSMRRSAPPTAHSSVISSVWSDDGSGDGGGGGASGGPSSYAAVHRERGAGRSRSSSRRVAASPSSRRVAAQPSYAVRRDPYAVEAEAAPDSVQRRRPVGRMAPLAVPSPNTSYASAPWYGAESGGSAAEWRVVRSSSMRSTAERAATESAALVSPSFGSQRAASSRRAPRTYAGRTRSVRSTMSRREVVDPYAHEASGGENGEGGTAGRQDARELMQRGRRRSKVGLINRKASQRRKSIVSTGGDLDGSFNEAVQRRRTASTSGEKLARSLSRAARGEYSDMPASYAAGSPVVHSSSRRSVASTVGSSAASVEPASASLRSPPFDGHGDVDMSPGPAASSDGVAVRSRSLRRRSTSRRGGDDGPSGFVGGEGDGESTAESPPSGVRRRRGRSGSMASRTSTLRGHGRASSGASSLSGVGSPKIDNAEQVPTDELEPVAGDVERVLAGALESAGSAEWETVFVSLETLRRIVVRSPEAVDREVMGELVGVIKGGMANLRSSVSRAALLLLENTFTFHGKAASVHIAAIVPDLVKKAGESSVFMQEQVQATLAAMVAHAATSRVIAAVCGEAGNKNKLIRGAVAYALGQLIEAKGARVFRAKDLGLYLSTVATLIGDRDSKVRNYAKAAARACYAASSDFEAVAASELSSSAARAFAAAAPK